MPINNDPGFGSDAFGAAATQTISEEERNKIEGILENGPYHAVVDLIEQENLDLSNPRDPKYTAFVDILKNMCVSRLCALIGLTNNASQNQYQAFVNKSLSQIQSGAGDIGAGGIAKYLFSQKVQNLFAEGLRQNLAIIEYLKFDRDAWNFMPHAPEMVALRYLESLERKAAEQRPKPVPDGVIDYRIQA